MGLADRVKGLDRHKIELPPSPPAPAFNIVKADQLIRELNDAIGLKYPDGCMTWLVNDKREIWTALCDAESDVDLAYISGQMDDLIKKADLLERMYLKAFDLFNSRPPIIEVQQELSL